LSALDAVSVQAAPIAVRAKLIAVELGAAPSIYLVREGGGWGWHRVARSARSHRFGPL
jgi:hypothetical protein